jgi:hypothetical protein
MLSRVSEGAGFTLSKTSCDRRCTQMPAGTEKSKSPSRTSKNPGLIAFLGNIIAHRGWLGEIILYSWR